MNSIKLRLLTVTAFLFIVPLLASAQTPEQVLQNPALLRELRSRIMSSGLTPDQVRARLRAEGYPENLLDAYLGAGEAGVSGEGTGAIQSTPEDILSAVAQLGIVDTVDALSIRCSTPGATDTTLTAADTVNIGRAQAMARKVALRNACLSRSQLNGSDSARRLALDSGFVIFGLNTFRESSTLFDPNLNGPVDANYRLGPGDRLALILTGDVNAAYTLDVTREGFIVVPQAGQIYVANLSLGELENIPAGRLDFSQSPSFPAASATFSCARSPPNSLKILRKRSL